MHACTQISLPVKHIKVDIQSWSLKYWHCIMPVVLSWITQNSVNVDVYGQSAEVCVNEALLYH